MGNFCNIKTPKIEDLSKAVGKNIGLTTIYVNQWQERGTKDDKRDSRYPTAKELKDFIWEKQQSAANADTVSKININQNSNYTRLRQVYNSTILNYRVNDIAQRFSEEVDAALHKELKRAKTHYDWALQKGDREAASELRHVIDRYNSPEGRQSVIRDLTLKKIFDNVRQLYQEASESDYTALYGEEKGTYMHNEYIKILENFDALLEEACDIISKRESFKVKLSYITDSKGQRTLDGTLEKTDDEQFAEDEDNEDNEDGSKVIGILDYDVRFIDPYLTQSREIRKIIGNITKIDFKGRVVTDDLGNIQKLNSEWVDQCLRDGMKNMVDARDFNYKDSEGEWHFPALEAMLPKYPWVNRIIMALKLKPELLGGFYSNYRQDFIHYAGQTSNENGVIVPTDFNKPVAQDSVLNETFNNYKERYILDDNSVYNADGTLNRLNAYMGDSIISDKNMYPSISDGEVNLKYQVPRISKVLRMLGFNTNNDYIERLLGTEAGVQSVAKVLEEARKIFSGIKDVKSEVDLTDYFKGYYRNIAEILGIVSEASSISSFRDPTTKKDRNNYSGPNYMTTLIKELKRNAPEFLEKEFGQDSWFKKDGKWRSGWIRLIETDASIRKNIDIKEVPSMVGKSYTDLTQEDLKAGLLREFYTIKESGAKHTFGWYVTPITADTPMATFVKMKRITGDFKKQLTPLLREVAMQEIDRIKLCKLREKMKVQKIQNFDYGRGKEFCFFPMFNSPDFMKKLSSAYTAWARYADRKLEDVYELLDSADKNTLLSNAITYSMNEGFKELITAGNESESDFLDYAAKILEDLGAIGNSYNAKEQKELTILKLEEFYWNHSYATTQMIELFATDLAYYKDGTDFQKRFKQCYAAGIKLNTFTKYGREFRNNVYIKDQIITSPSYLDLKQALDEAIAEGRIMNYDRDNILYKFRDVNVADAQAWITPETMRSVLDMMGKWDKKTMDPAFERFKAGKWDMGDFEIIWQTIKPFMYTQIQKPDGAGGWLRVPHQNKNSEFLVLAAFSTVAAATKNSSKLKAIHNFMRKNNIDSIQMETAVKCGGQGIIELNYSEAKLQNALTDEIRSAAFEKLGEKGYSKTNDYGIFKAGNDSLLDSGRITQEEYNKRFHSVEMTSEEIMKTLKKNVFLENGEFDPEVVHTIPYRDYMIQQPTPQHMIDEEGIFGSQIRNIALADLPDNFSITIDGHTYTKTGFIEEFSGCIVANVLQSFNKVNSRFSDINSLQNMLLDQIRSNSAKYSSDLINALQLVDVVTNGKIEKGFKIPSSFPSISQTMQELMTSAYKNQVTKQYIKGGNAILVSSWGKTDELHLEYETRNGKKCLSGVQCYLPASSRKFYKPFLKQVTENGKTYYELNIKKLKEAGLDKLIGYRIPTENKYSMVPLKIMGFLPQQNGSAIMLPAEITAIAGSDFDIDKLFLMIPEFEGLPGLDRYKLRKRLLQDAEFKKFNLKKNDLDIIFDEIENRTIAFSEGSAEMYVWDYYDSHTEEFTRKSTENGVRKIQYDYSKSMEDNTREQRNNHLIDLMWSMLTSQPLSAEVTSPGNFDSLKLHDRLAQVYNDPKALQEFKTVFNLETDEQTIGFIKKLADSRKVGNTSALDILNDFLKDYKKKFNTERNPLSPSTFLYYHRQNMTAGKLIGIYANNTSMHLKYQHSPMEFKVPFKINGRTVKTLDLQFSTLGESVTKNCAEFQAASVDGVKDPVLATLLQNEDTAKITGLMLRAGLSIAEISYLFNQPSVKKLVELEGNLKNYLKYHGYDKKDGWRAVMETVQTANLTSEMLLSNIISEEKNEYNMETARRFIAYFIWAADYLNDITSISRSDSPNGAIANSLGKAFIQIRKVDWIHNSSYRPFYPFKFSNGVPNNTYKPSYRELMMHPIATLQAFYTCGIKEAFNSLSRYFPQLNDKTREMLQIIIDNANTDFLRYSTADKTVNAFFKGITQFALNRTKLFGNDDNLTFEQKRDYYLTEFPSEFVQIKNSNKEIGNLGIIRKITVEKGRLILESSGQLRQFTKDLYRKDLDSLVSMGETGRNLAYKLFMYSFYADGLFFGPTSFGNYFSSEFVSSFNEITDTLRNLDTLFEDETLYQRFLSQFISDNFKVFPSIRSNGKYKITQDETDSRYIHVPLQIAMNKTTYSGNYNFVRYKEMEMERFYMLSGQSGDSLIYKEIPVLVPNGIYNPNYGLEELTVFNSGLSAPQETGFPNTLFEDMPEDMFNMPDTGSWQPATRGQQQTQQELGPETKINIYAGAGENVDLSNFAERPFVTNVTNLGIDLDSPRKFRNVESAFQAAKIAYTNMSISEKFEWLKKFENTTGAKARELGKQIPKLNSSRWDKNSSRIMKEIIKASFQQNPQALQRLLVTGNATLTHTQAEIKPVKTGSMNYVYKEHVGGKRADVKSDTTLEAIQNGERTATTRYVKEGNIPYWSTLKVGDIVEWHDEKGNKVKVKITKPLTKLPLDTNAEEWSKKEGWSVEHFNKKVKPEIEKGEAYQMEFEKIVDWGIEFPRILMEVRDELAKENSVNLNQTQQTNQSQGKIKRGIFEKVNSAISEQGVKLDKDYQAAIIRHLETDNISYYDLDRKELVNLAKVLFDYFNKNGFKIRVVNKPYSEKEANAKSSAVLIQGKYATIYYVKQENQESPFLTLLHELLHIATFDAIPFDSMGRAIEDEQLQAYYNAFVASINTDSEYKKYKYQLLNAKTQEEFESVPYKYRVLYHAEESVGEFLSSFLNEKEVRAATSITYGEGRTLFEWLKDKLEEFLSKFLFKQASYIPNRQVLEDITNFLLNYQYQGEVNLQHADPEYVEYITESNEKNEKAFNLALNYKDIKTPKAVNTSKQNKKQQYEKQSDMPLMSTAAIIEEINAMTKEYMNSQTDGLESIDSLLSHYNPDESNEINKTNLCKPE